MDQDLGLLQYKSPFITLEEYSSQISKKDEFDVYKNVIYDLEESENSNEEPYFYEAWTLSA